MDEFAQMASREREAKRIARRQWFWLHAAVFVPIQVILFVLWISIDAKFPWFALPLFGWGMLLAVHGVYAFLLKTPEEIMIERAARHEPAA